MAVKCNVYLLYSGKHMVRCVTPFRWCHIPGTLELHFGRWRLGVLLSLTRKSNLLCLCSHISFPTKKHAHAIQPPPELYSLLLEGLEPLPEIKATLWGPRSSLWELLESISCGPWKQFQRKAVTLQKSFIKDPEWCPIYLRPCRNLWEMSKTSKGDGSISLSVFLLIA